VSNVKIKTNFKKKRLEIQEYARRLPSRYLKAAMFYVLNEWGNVTVNDYMVNGGGGATGQEALANAIGVPVNSSKLTMRSQRLAKAYLAAPSFNRRGLDKHLVDAVGKKQPSIASGSTEEGTEGRKKVIVHGMQIEGVLENDVPYAAIHEYGGTINHTNLFGRGIAADIVIPKRPSVTPARDKILTDGTAKRIFKKAIEGSFEDKRI